MKVREGSRHNSYLGKVRVFLAKDDHDTVDGFEALRHEHFDDRIISDVDDISTAELIAEEISNGEFTHFGLRDLIKGYADGAVLELVGDVHIEFSKSWTDCGWEYDAEVWLENPKIHQLTPEQKQRFCSEEQE